MCRLFRVENHLKNDDNDALCAPQSNEYLNIPVTVNSPRIPGFFLDEHIYFFRQPLFLLDEWQLTQQEFDTLHGQKTLAPGETSL